MSTLGRERLIVEASTWAGWCADHDWELSTLTLLSDFLLDVKHQMALDRPTHTTPKEGTP